MKLKAAVKYLGALAHYVVYRTRAGIYEARLLRYDGSPDFHPPHEILMIRGAGHWSGDIHDREFTDKIGYTIEEEARKGDIFEQSK